MQAIFSNCFLAVNLLVQWSPHLIELKKNLPFKDPGYVPASLLSVQKHALPLRKN